MCTKIVDACRVINGFWPSCSINSSRAPKLFGRPLPALGSDRNLVLRRCVTRGDRFPSPSRCVGGRVLDASKEVTTTCFAAFSGRHGAGLVIRQSKEVHGASFRSLFLPRLYVDGDIVIAPITFGKIGIANPHRTSPQ